jgi:hypothetical protein
MQKQKHKDKMNKMCRVTSNYDSSQLKLMQKKKKLDSPRVLGRFKS